jgi:hypothetical protein
MNELSKQRHALESALETFKQQFERQVKLLEEVIERLRKLEEARNA